VRYVSKSLKISNEMPHFPYFSPIDFLPLLGEIFVGIPVN